MNLKKWFDGKLGNYLKKKSFVSPSYAELFSTDKQRLPAPYAHNYAPYLDTYSDSAWVYACVSAIIKSASNLNFVLKDKRGKVLPDDSEIMKLLYRPSPFFNRRTLFEYIISGLELTGNAYILKDARRGNQPTELYPLIPSMVEILTNGGTAERPITGYKYTVTSGTATYLPEDIIHIKYFNPADFFYGLAPLAAARVTIDTLNASEKYNKAFFDNSANVGGLLYRDDTNPIPVEMRNRIITSWNSKFQGEGNAHKVALLEGGLKWQATTINQKDMEFVNGFKINRESILSIFGVPPAMVGLFEYAPQFNTKEQQRIFYNNTVIPKLKLIAEALTEFLLPDFDGTGYYFDIDTSDISILLGDAENKAAAASVYQTMGFSQNEIIDAMGLPFPKTKDGEIRNTPQYLLHAGAFGVLNAPTGSGKKFVAKIKTKALLTPVQARKHQKERIKIVEPYIDKVAADVESHFTKQGQSVQEYIDKNKKIPAEYSDVFDIKIESENLFKAKQKNILDLLEEGKEKEASFVSDALIAAGKKTFRVKAAGLGNAWYKKRGTMWANESEEFSKKLIDKMLAEVNDSVAAGQSIDEGASDLAQFFDEDMRYRAARIAQTETIAALNQSALNAYAEETFIVGKEWLSALGETTRETHAAASGQVVAKDADFKVGTATGPAPAQLDEVGENVNCRCAIIPIIED